MIRYIRGEARFRNTHIVVITANQLWRNQINERDIQQFLVKPVSIENLVAVANKLTGHKR